MLYKFYIQFKNDVQKKIKTNPNPKTSQMSFLYRWLEIFCLVSFSLFHILGVYFRFCIVRIFFIFFAEP